MLLLLVVVAASVCNSGWRGGPPRIAKSPAGVEISALQDSFRVPPDDAKLMVRWWWFGPAVTTQELDRELHQMKDAGIGGFEVATVYPLTVDDPAKGLINLHWLSPEHLAAVSSTARTAHELGLRMDMTMGSGWPYGGPHITPELAAKQLHDFFSSGAVDDNFLGGTYGFFVASGNKNHLDPGSIREINGRGDHESSPHPLPRGTNITMEIGYRLTGQKVKRAAVGAEGLVLDHYNRAAIEEHLKAVGEPLAAAGNGYIRAMFCDSLEVYGADWTADFLNQFQRHRGYDLKPLLPALFADIGPQTMAIRHDWGQTLTELLNENFLEPYQAWCHQHHVLARVQAYGAPPAQLSSYRFVDLPEGEQGDEAGHWNHFTASRWASSAGHVYGKPVTSAEAFTWIHSLPFRATPLDFKAMADEYFLEGINQLIGHGWPYSPPGVPEPGWHLYAAGALDPHNPWWFVMPDLALYIQRASFMLRQGRPAIDIAVYLPTHDAWADLTPGHVNLWEAIWRKLGPNILPSLLEAGYGVDFVDDEILAHDARVENGKLAIANQQFSVVIMPGIERIPPPTLSKLGEFAKSGGILVATRRLPSLAPGYLHHEAETAAVAQQVEDIFKRSGAPAHFVPGEDKGLEDALNRLYPPDVDFSPRTPDLGFIHRHKDTAEIYFIANTSNRQVQARAEFRVKGKNPEWWDLFTGKVTPAQALPGGGGRTAVALDLEPYGSRLLVFTDGAPSPRETHPSELPRREAIDISRDWVISFEGTDKKITMDALRPWTEIAGMKYFSGHATYERKVSIPAESLANGTQVYLNLGDPTPIQIEKAAHDQAWLDGPVREAAEVNINGRRAGSIWHPPYELDVTSYLHPGDNELRIVVGNTAINEMAGKPLPDRRQLTAKYGERFVDQGTDLVKPVPSGLTGPIRLVVRSAPATVSSSR
jgi:hypothetical protein